MARPSCVGGAPIVGDAGGHRDHPVGEPGGHGLDPGGDFDRQVVDLIADLV